VWCSPNETETFASSQHGGPANMTAKNTKISKLVKYNNLDDMPSAPPLSKAVKAMSDAEIERRAAEDVDAGAVPKDFWDKAQVIEPEGTEQITLRLPRRVLEHFKATGKGYQTRISCVLASYVDAMGRKLG
jgi:uncharacterized protein (DUF4415 family)